MLVTDSIDEIRSAVKLWKREKLSVALVPTMGALHEGHLALIRQARQEADRVVVSIFVNPEQFGPDEDYDRYPRRPDDDLKFCQKSRVSAVFMPETSTIYPDEPVLSIGLDRKSTRLNSSHVAISYAVFCLKKKQQIINC